MKNWKRILALFTALVLALSLCACNAGGSDESPAPTGDPSDAPSGAADPGESASPAIEVDRSQDALAFAAGLSAGDTLLTVNGVDMPADLVLYWLSFSCSSFMSSYGMFGLSVADYAQPLLDDSVNICAYNALLRQRAAELGCLPTDAQVQAARESMVADGQERYDLLKTAYGLSDDAMEFIFTTSAYYENMLDAVVPAVTDEMLNSYVYQAKHILLLTVDMEGQPTQQEDGSYSYPPLDEAAIAEKKAQAEDILAQLQAADDLEAKFDELMNEFSEDGRGEDGALGAPDGYTTTLGEMVPEFEQGALALGFGEISGIVESSYGYHIILRGEVADLQSYTDQYREYRLDDELGALLDAAEIVRAPALESLDVASFYERYVAYQNAVVAESEPAESEGVG